MFLSRSKFITTNKCPSINYVLQESTVAPSNTVMQTGIGATREVITFHGDKLLPSAVIMTTLLIMQGFSLVRNGTQCSETHTYIQDSFVQYGRECRQTPSL